MDKNKSGILEVEPLRNLGFWTIWALGVGSVVGDGIFLLLGEGIGIAGPSAIFSFFIAGLIQMVMMIGMGEFSVAMPFAGAMSAWVERIFGKWWGFLSGITFAWGWVITGGSTGLAMGRMTCWFFPNLDINKWTIIFAVMWVTLFAILNIIGVAIAAKVQLGLVFALMTTMVLFGVLGLKHVEFSNFSNMLPFGWGGFFKAIPMGTYAYMGAITLATAGGECKDPKDMPKALIWSSVTFLVVYSLSQFVVLGTIPWQEITMDASPFTIAAGKIFGTAGAAIINTAAVVAAATTILMGTIYAPSRIFYGLAKSQILPEKFAYLHPKTRTPVFGIVVTWALAMVLIAWGSINPDMVYVTLSNQMVFAWSISWGLALVAAMLFRKRHFDEIKKAGWTQPLFPLFPILGLLGVGMVLYFSFAGDFVGIVLAAVTVIILRVYYSWYVKRRENDIEI